MIELQTVGRLAPFYTPTAEALDVLNTKQWICSFSGGKDSTSLVTWIEWLRRSGQITVPNPKLVMSDTGVEFPFLQEIAHSMIDFLTSCGWICEVVRPRLKEKLYNQIFGRGLSPTHPANRRFMRWCTRATKIDPMSRFAKTLRGGVLQLSGVRWGESQSRDGKLKKSGCSAGGECGLPEPEQEQKEGDLEVYAPIINWKVCQVVDWLTGAVSKDIRETMSDSLTISRRLMSVYEVKVGDEGFGLAPPKVSALRFGCIGCPAIGKSKLTGKQLRDNPAWKSVKRIYRLWEELWNPENRLPPKKLKKPGSFGPVRMSVRKRLFPELLSIQEEAGITLVNEEDIAFIYKCWEDGVYPRGWSVEDETRTVDRLWKV